MNRLRKILQSETRALFLDRDGVINKRLPDDYVKTTLEFEFLPGVQEALKMLSHHFSPVIVVTNQQGIGRGLMTTAALEEVHRYMKSEISKASGRIDKIYFSPDLSNSRSFTRKPAVGMGLAARKDFPEIRFRNSVMVGDSASDLLFGKRLGMFTVLITHRINITGESARLADGIFPDLISFAQFVENLIHR